MSGEVTSRGTWVLAVAAVVFAVLILPQVVEDGGDPALTAGVLPSATVSALPSGLPVLPAPGATLPAASAPTPGAAGGGDGSSGGGGDGDGGDGSDGRSSGEVPTVAPDPTAEAFDAVRPGDCLNVFHTGTGWNTRVPRTVSCAADAAFMRVTAVDRTCPTGSGRTYWSYGDIRICMQREFRRGQCFLADRTSGSGRNAVFTAQLLSWVDCDAKRVPADYDTVLVISDLYRAPKTVPAGACARGAGDRTAYWYWIANGGSTLVCAGYPAA